jgi:hypothetical protein
MDFMQTKISYIYREGRGNTCDDLKCCLQLAVFGICIIALIALFCSLKISFAFTELPKNINPYDNSDWKYA